MDITKEKLLKRPVEEDTRIEKQVFVEFDEGIGLYEKWYWSGVSANSVILLAETVEKINQQDLIVSLFRQMQLDEKMRYTTSLSGDYFYLNFGFKTE